MIRKRHCLLLEQGVAGEVRFVNRLFLLPHQSVQDERAAFCHGDDGAS